MNATARNKTRAQVCGLFDRLAWPPACGLHGVPVDVVAKAASAKRACTHGCQRRLAAMFCALTTLQAASLLLAPGAQAQTNACDLLKLELAARIEATGVRGYSLEAVPADAPVPPDAKAIGNCEAGASKIVYRRWGATRPSSGGASAAEPASAAQAVVVPDKQPARSTVLQSGRASQAATASAPSPAPRPLSRSTGAASAVPAPAHEPEKFSLGASAGEVAALRSIEPAVAQPAQVQFDEAPVAKVSLAQQASEFMAENGRWIWALIFLPVAGLLWVWRAHRRAYDAAGLPRGPKL